mmetsp:Transcript_6543/g.11803  ORF Transcript_6543/g.11803 Transcript_6543/m.11803 type:complete len:234 (+) Transcript_6543:894-1595(+)
MGYGRSPILITLCFNTAASGQCACVRRTLLGVTQSMNVLLAISALIASGTVTPTKDPSRLVTDSPSTPSSSSNVLLKEEFARELLEFFRSKASLPARVMNCMMKFCIESPTWCSRNLAFTSGDVRCPLCTNINFASSAASAALGRFPRKLDAPFSYRWRKSNTLATGVSISTMSVSTNSRACTFCCNLTVFHQNANATATMHTKHTMTTMNTSSGGESPPSSLTLPSDGTVGY